MAFPTTVLPLPQDDIFADEPSLQQAYARVSAYEIDHFAPISNPLPARWLGHLLREVPIKESLAREINSCADDSEIEELSAYYQIRFLRVCESTCFPRRATPCTQAPYMIVKPAGGPTPAPSDHPSRTSFNDAIQMNAAEFCSVPRDHGEAKRWVHQFSQYYGQC